MKLWQKFSFQLKFFHFNRILLLINSEVKSEDWYRTFLSCKHTQWFFERLKLKKQIEFIEKVLKAFELSYSATNDPREEFS
jgi:hypothetical protein